MVRVAVWCTPANGDWVARVGTKEKPHFFIFTGKSKKIVEDTHKHPPWFWFEKDLPTHIFMIDDDPPDFPRIRIEVSRQQLLYTTATLWRSPLMMSLMQIALAPTEEERTIITAEAEALLNEPDVFEAVLALPLNETVRELLAPHRDRLPTVGKLAQLVQHWLDT